MQVESTGILPFVPPVVPSDPRKRIEEFAQLTAQVKVLGTKIQSIESHAEGHISKRDLSIMYFNYGKIFETGSYYVIKQTDTVKFLNSAFYNYCKSRETDPELNKLSGEPGKGVDRTGNKLVSMGAAKLVVDTPVKTENPDLLRSKDVSDLSKQKKPKKHKECIIL